MESSVLVGAPTTPDAINQEEGIGYPLRSNHLATLEGKERTRLPKPRHTFYSAPSGRRGRTGSVREPLTWVLFLAGS
jgi:hypothetical protein